MSEPAVFVRYGIISEVSRFTPPTFPVERGQNVVVSTLRGLQLGTVLERTTPSNGTSKTNGHDADDAESSFERVVRIATSDDEQLVSELRSAAQQEFASWVQRIGQWKLALELIDLEWTLDRTKLILYVL